MRISCSVLVFSVLMTACSSGSDSTADAGTGDPVADSGASPGTDAQTPVTDASIPDALELPDATATSDASPGDASAPSNEATVSFANASGTNATTTTYSAASTTSASATKSQTEVTLSTSAGVRTTTVSLKSAYTAGQTFTLGSPYDNTPDQAVLAYTEKIGQWYATGGTVTIETVGSGSFVFHVKDATMVPAPQEKVATGTFTLKADGPTKVN